MRRILAALNLRMSGYDHNDNFAVECILEKIENIRDDREWLMNKLKCLLFGEDRVSGQDVADFKERFPDESEDF